VRAIGNARPALRGYDAVVGVQRSIKCVLEPSRFRGQDAIRKRLERTEPPWRFYMRREIAIYEAFSKLDLPVRVPRLLDADAERGFIILQRVAGKPLASRRHVVPKDRQTWEALISTARAVRSIACHVDVKPTPADTRAMRERLLEDPTSPTGWISSGLLECARRGLLAPDVAARLAKDVKGAVFQHGDLLLRNVIRDDAGLVLVDWECAGTHAEGWDAALLSVFAPPWARAALADGLDAPSFHACFVFALLRELVFRHGRYDAITARLEDELARAL
jgi:hypothetical protein